MLIIIVMIVIMTKVNDGDVGLMMTDDNTLSGEHAGN